MSIGPWIAANTKAAYLVFASVTAAGVMTGLPVHFVSAASLLALGGAVLHGRRQQRRISAVRRQERTLRKEMLSYLLFNGSARSMPAADLGRHISRLVAVRSSFPRAALVLQGAGGELSVAGSAGFDDLGVEALNRWGSRLSTSAAEVTALLNSHERVGSVAFTLPLERRGGADRNPLSAMVCARVHAIPLRSTEGLLGLLVVSADTRSTARVTDTIDLMRPAIPATVLPLADLLEPLEALALRLTMQLAAPETVTPVWPAASHRGDRRKRPGHPRDRSAAPSRVPPAAVDRRSLDTEALPVNNPDTAAALEQVRQIIAPGSAPVQRISGVSGRPPRSIWRSTAAGH